MFADQLICLKPPRPHIRFKSQLATHEVSRETPRTSTFQRRVRRSTCPGPVPASTIPCRLAVPRRRSERTLPTRHWHGQPVPRNQLSTETALGLSGLHVPSGGAVPAHGDAYGGRLAHRSRTRRERRPLGHRLAFHERAGCCRDGRTRDGRKNCAALLSSPHEPPRPLPAL